MEAEKKIKQVKQDYENDFIILREQIDQLNNTIEQLEKNIEAKEYTIQSKESEIFVHKGNIMNLEEELEKLRNLLANGDANAGDLQRLLAETQQKLEQSL